MGFRVGAPAPQAGYNRTSDWPTAGGTAATPVNGFRSGSTKGLSAMVGLSSTAAPGRAGTWHPTIAWMLGFIIVEMFAFQMLSRFLNL